VDRSTVSRHFKNHVLPALAESVLLETTDVALGNIVEAFERLYAERWRLYQMAVAAGDMKMAHANLVELRKLLEAVVGFASKMKGANLADLRGRDEAAEFRHMEEVRVQLIERLDTLLGRHEKNIRRGDEQLNTEEIRRHGRSLNLDEYEPASTDTEPASDNDGTDAVDAEPTPLAPPRSAPPSSPKKGFGPLSL
jgi:hypothetical protein